MTSPEFMIHNRHLEDAQGFEQTDPQLRVLKLQPYVYVPEVMYRLPKTIPGVYTITGGRQIGKTTLSKQWMHHLLDEGVQPEAIAYFTGETIVDHLSLIKQLQTYLESMPQDTLRYLIVDEVTYISNWDMGIKFLADGGLLEDVILVLTGSDLAIIEAARLRFPGRRGKSNQVDYHLNPLSFYEILQLYQTFDNLDDILESDNPNPKDLDYISNQFEKYLIHGGYLTAVNDFARDETIHLGTLDTYSDWIRGDVIKHGKNNYHCSEFFNAMLNRLGSQVTWANLAQDFSIDHHSTVASYAELLQSMDVIFIQKALDENKLSGATKKARKLNFIDPFIHHAIYAWLNPCKDPMQQLILPAIEDPNRSSDLVEACVVSHFKRWYPTYYIKAEGEVDVAYINDKKFWPVEVKWRNQIRSKDLKQINKYKKGIILGKQNRIQKLGDLDSYPLPWYLAKLSRKNITT